MNVALDVSTIVSFLQNRFSRVKLASLNNALVFDKWQSDFVLQSITGARSDEGSVEFECTLAQRWMGKGAIDVSVPHTELLEYIRKFISSTSVCRVNFDGISKPSFLSIGTIAMVVPLKLVQVDVKDGSVFFDLNLLEEEQAR